MADGKKRRNAGKSSMTVRLDQKYQFNPDPCSDNGKFHETKNVI